jgi:hypothetical protein
VTPSRNIDAGPYAVSCEEAFEKDLHECGLNLTKALNACPDSPIAEGERCIAAAGANHDKCCTDARQRFRQCMIDATGQYHEDLGEQLALQYARGVKEGLLLAHKQVRTIKNEIDTKVKPAFTRGALLMAGGTVSSALGAAMAEGYGYKGLAQTLKIQGSVFAVTGIVIQVFSSSLEKAGAKIKAIADKADRSLIYTSSTGQRRAVGDGEISLRSIGSLKAELRSGVQASVYFTRAWVSAAQSTSALNAIVARGPIDMSAYIDASGHAAAIRSNYGRAAEALQQLVVVGRRANELWQLTLADVGREVGDPKAAAKEMRRAWKEERDSELAMLLLSPSERKELERLVARNLRNIPQDSTPPDELISERLLKRFERLQVTLIETATAAEGITPFP